MRAFFLLVVVVSAAVADEAVKVEQPAVLEDLGPEARTEETGAEATAGGEVEELSSWTGAVDIGERSAVPAAPILPYQYSAYYWPQVAVAAPSQLARSDVRGVAPAVGHPYSYSYSYYPYAYTYPYYTYPYTPLVAAPPAPAPPVGASVYYGNWQ